MEKLGTEKINKLLVRFAIPSIIGLMVGVVYNIVDRIFIGQEIGVIGIAGISIILPLATLYLGIGLLIGVGTTVLISIAMGKKNYKEVEELIGNALFFYIVIGILLGGVFQLYLKDVLLLLGATQEVLPYALDYSRIVLWGSIGFIMTSGFTNIIRGTGSPSSIMTYSFIGAFLNIVLDWLFIVKFSFGMKGAAYATLISVVVSVTLMVTHYMKGKSIVKLYLKNIRPRKKYIKKILSIGSGAFTLQVANSLLVVIVNNRFKTFGGDIFIAAYGIINSLALVFRLPVVGIQQGAQTIIGYNLGSKNYGRIRETYFLALKAAGGISILGFLVSHFFPGFLVNLFIKGNKELVEVGSKGIMIFFSTIFLQGFNIISNYLFMALGDGKTTFRINILQQLCLAIPLTYFLPEIFGVYGALYGVPIALAITAMVSITMAIRKVNEIEKNML